MCFCCGLMRLIINFELLNSFFDKSYVLAVRETKMGMWTNPRPPSAVLRLKVLS